MSLARLVWIVTAVAAIQACSPAPEQHVDSIPSVQFDGSLYDIGYASNLRIAEQDLVAIGSLSESFPRADGLSVFALRGVDPRKLIMMQAIPGEGIEYLVGFARGSLPDGDPDETEVESATRLLTAIPGLCQFHVSPLPGAC